MIWQPSKRIIRPYDKPSFEWTQRFGINRKHPLGDPDGLWIMNEGSGSKVFDSSGNQNIGVGDQISWVNGHQSPAIFFNGAIGGADIDCGGSSLFDYTDNFSLVSYVKPTVEDHKGIIGKFTSSTYEGYLICLRSIGGF